MSKSNIIKETTIHTPSEEQQIILDHVKNGKNVIVNAVAGSGKSTTILSLAKELPNKTILQITYNSRLRYEIKEKIEYLSFTNIHIHTFHSLAVKYYLPTAYTDTELRHILYMKTPPQKPIHGFDILVLDEAQDMSFLYYQFIRKFIIDSKIPHLQLLVLGDYNQCLYQFKGADARFLTKADEIWSTMDVFQDNSVIQVPKKRGRPPKNQTVQQSPLSIFVHCTLKVSYRITQPIAHFVNNAMLGENRMIACKDGVPVVYIRNIRHNIAKTVVYEIQKILESGDKPSDIFILGGSVRGPNSHIRKMENILVENNIPCYIPLLDQDNDDRVVEGKIVFSTFHAVKGRQRKHVFVIGFDQSYFNYFARNMDSSVCPNTLYVAATRPTHRLYLLEFEHTTTDRPLDFLKMTHHDMVKSEHVHFKGTPRILFYKSIENDCGKKLLEKKIETPTGLIKFIPDHVMDVILPIINQIFNSTVESYTIIIDIPNIISTECGFEDVSDLNGIAIPAMYYDEIKKQYGIYEKNILYNLIENSLLEMRENEHIFLKNIVKEIPETCETIDDYLFLANVYTSIQERLYFKLKQIQRTEYNWLSPQIIELCKTRLNTIFNETEKNEEQNDSENIKDIPITEYKIIHHSMEELHEKIDICLLNHFAGTKMENYRFRFSAIIDLFTSTTIWEIKCTSKITIDHQLQLIIYAWLWKITERKERKFKLFNIKTGEIWILNATLEELTNIVVTILKGKYETNTTKTDEEFMSEIYNANT